MDERLFAGEVLASVSVRRFYVGVLSADSLSPSPGSVIKLSHVLMFDGMQSEKGMDYMATPDPVMFTDNPTIFSTDKFIGFKELNKDDEGLASSYRSNVQRFRVAKLGISVPPKSSLVL